MTHIDLFSGIGGFSLAAGWAGFQTIVFVEIDSFCQKVLHKHWPEVPIFGDIHDLTGEILWKELARNVNNQKKHLDGHTVNPATQNELPYGGQTILENTEKLAGIGVKKESGKSSNTTEESVFAVEKQQESSLPLTTKIITETLNGENTNLKLGNSQLREDCQTIIKSFATTATTPGQITEPVRTREEVKIDLLTAGVPCQPASCAGKRRGTKDDRWLWGETYRIIREVKPKWIILENVRGLLTLEQGVVFQNLLSELEGYGYEVWPVIIPACAVNAPHRRDRVWIVANNISEQKHAATKSGFHPKLGEQNINVADTPPERFSTTQSGVQTSEGKVKPSDWNKNWYEVATRFCGVDARVPNRVDRLKSLGNSIVPQVAYEIIKGIAEIENTVAGKSDLTKAYNV